MELGEATGAREVYEAALSAGGPGTRLRLGLGRALAIGGDEAGAFAAWRAAVAPFDADPAATRPDEYWHAWTLMLELLAARNADGSRTGAIRVQITRLESADAGLGGEPWRTRIGRVRDALPPG